MPPTPPNQQMGDLHEQALAAAFGARKTRASGSQWHDQGDVRNAHDAPFAFCLDGKSTKGKSISVTLDMIAKIREQAQGERPGFGLRWYGTDDLKTILEDLVLLQLADVEEMLPAARAWVELEAALAGDITPQRVSELLANAAGHSSTIEQLQRELEEMRMAVATAETIQESLGEKLAQAKADRDRYKAQVEMRIQPSGGREGTAVPGYVPRLPWTVVSAIHRNSTVVHAGIFYDQEGYQRTFNVASVRVERMPNATNRPRLIVNDIRVPEGDLYVDGKLRARVSVADPSIEKG